MQFLTASDFSDFLDKHNGEVPAFAWPGGYPLYYVAADGAILSPKAVNEEMDEVLSCWLDNTDDGDAWRIIACEIHWKGEPLTCAHTDEEIPSAYGPVEA